MELEMRQRGRETRRDEGGDEEKSELSWTKTCLLLKSVKVDRRATVRLAVRVVVDCGERMRSSV